MIVPVRLFLVAVALVSVLQADPLGFLMWSSSELEQRDAALSTRVGPDHSARETLADYGNPFRAHRFRLIHRDADGIPEQHEHIEDVVFIKSGEATFLHPTLTPLSLTRSVSAYDSGKSNGLCTPKPPSEDDPGVVEGRW